MAQIWQYVQAQLQTNQFFSAAAFAGLLGSLLLYGRQAAGWAWTQVQRRLLFSATFAQSDPLFYNFETWFYAHKKKYYRNVEASVIQNNPEIHVPPQHTGKPLKPTIYFRQNVGVFLIRHQGRWLLIQKGRDKMENASSFHSLYFNQYTISGFMARKAITDLLNRVVEYAHLSNQDKTRVFSHDEWGEWCHSSSTQSRNFDNLVLPLALSRTLKEDLSAFIDSKEWYVKNAIPWRRGYLLHGPPGNGKTSIAMAAASHVGRDLYSLDLGGLSDNGRLKRAFSSLPENAILLLEDLDSHFAGRESRDGVKVSFSALLNCLDGVASREGLITIITTNHPDRLDPALKRTGRVDVTALVCPPGVREVNAYLRRFYGHDTPALDYYEGAMSMSEIQEACVAHKNSPQAALMLIESNQAVTATQ